MGLTIKDILASDKHDRAVGVQPRQACFGSLDTPRREQDYSLNREDIDSNESVMTKISEEVDESGEIHYSLL